MKLELFNNQANAVWRQIAGQASPELLKMELDLYQKLFFYFQVGDCYFLIFNFQKLDFDFVGPEIKNVLGYEPEETTASLMMDAVHSDDREWFLKCQQRTARFLMSLPDDKLMKYKLRFDCRFRKKNGEYLRLMQQVIVAQTDDTGGILKTLIVHTDISHIKSQGSPVLSFIGIDGEPSFLNVNVQDNLLIANNSLTKREKEILALLIEGKQSKQIGTMLNISKYTVDTHRKNMLKKNNLVHVGQLVSRAIRNGWI